jgi:hypothetical protein
MIVMRGGELEHGELDGHKARARLGKICRQPGTSGPKARLFRRRKPLK